MTLPDGLLDVPRGKIASVVTHLEMNARAPRRPEPGLEGIDLRLMHAPSADWYKALFRHVGADDWLWFSRLTLDDTALEAVIRHPDVDVYALIEGGRDEGLLELDFRIDGECELAFFGVSRALVGRGAGRFLMNRAMELAWARDIRRFWVHTCTLDHPAALGFYIRSGFTPYRQQVEIADDPRLIGLLPETAAPHVPIHR